MCHCEPEGRSNLPHTVPGVGLPRPPLQRRRARNDSRVYIVVGTLLLLLCACRDDRLARGPEDLVLDADSAGPAFVETTISGMVFCGTCPPGTPMIIEVRDVRSTAVEPLLARPFAQFGAYQLTLKVLEKTLLAVHARVFAPGGTITDERQVEVPEGNEKVTLTVNLDVP